MLEKKKQQMAKKGCLDSQEEDHRSDNFASLDGEIF